jgi:threonine 3-dehydrogenase
MQKTMRAVVKAKGEVGGTEFRDVPVPDVGPNDVLIKVKVASICGTDVHIYEYDAWAQNRLKLPLVYGHEFAGEVVQIGSNVRHVKVGENVSGECHIACGHCFNCRNNMQHICLNTKIFGVDRAGTTTRRCRRSCARYRTRSATPCTRSSRRISRPRTSQSSA